MAVRMRCSHFPEIDDMILNEVIRHLRYVLPKMQLHPFRTRTVGKSTFAMFYYPRA